MNRVQAGLQTRTVTINVEFSITLECSELEGNNLYWIGLHDMNKNGRHRWADCLDKAPRLSIRIDIWILLSDTVCQLIQFYTNSEAALLSSAE